MGVAEHYRNKVSAARLQMMQCGVIAISKVKGRRCSWVSDRPLSPFWSVVLEVRDLVYCT